MKFKKILLLQLLTIVINSLSVSAQPFIWNTDVNGIYRNGSSFFLNGQSWAKATPFTDATGTTNEALVKAKLSELSAIGVNTIRIYGSPNDSDWGNPLLSNFANLIRWIEEWNDANPDGGNPNKAMYYLVQISPQDNLSTLSDKLPTNDKASFDRAIHSTTNPGSVASIVSTTNTAAGAKGSRYLLGYLIYHELNISAKYTSWYNTIGAQGIENFMNAVADAIHTTYAVGKLVSHTGDAKDTGNGTTVNLYQEIENLDSTPGNVFKNFDLIGFNLYISTDALLKENLYYDRIVNRRSFSVNSNRGWYIGETGASYDRDADPNNVAAANYENHQGGANLEIMWQKSKDLGNLIGFMLFTVQDNDTDLPINSAIKQRGHYDFYGDKKFLFYIYKDILVDKTSTNNRFHTTVEHEVGVSIIEGVSNYTITFYFKNKTNKSKEFFWSIHGDAGSGSQRFSNLVEEAYVVLAAGQEKSIIKTVSKPSNNNLFAVSASVIKEKTPVNQYFYGREHLYSDGISTIAGLNLNLNNPTLSLPNFSAKDESNLKSGLLFVNNENGINIPEGSWELTVYSLTGAKLFSVKLHNPVFIKCREILPNVREQIVVYRLERI